MKNKVKFTPNSSFKLMDQVLETQRCYLLSLCPFNREDLLPVDSRRYIYFYGKKHHPEEIGAGEAERFLSHLATVENVAASTQRQALNALVFLCRDVLLTPGMLMSKTTEIYTHCHA